MCQHAVDFRWQRLEIDEVHHTDCAAANLVFIGWTNAAASRSDLGAGIGGCIFTHAVQFAVKRENQCRVVCNFQIFRRDRHALGAEFVDFSNKRMWVHNDAVADNSHFAFADNARWQKRQLVAYAVDYQRVARIVAALIAHNDVGALGEPVDYLAFSFITPLGADDNDIRHSNSYPVTGAATFHALARTSNPRIYTL